MKDTIEPGFLGWGLAVGVIAIAVTGWLWQPAAVAQSAATTASDKKVAAPAKQATRRVAGSKAPAKRAAATKKAAAPTSKKPAATDSKKPATTTAKKPPAAAKKPTKPTLVAALLLPSFDATLQRVMKVVEMAAARELKKVSQEFIRNVAVRLFPNLKQVQLHKGIQLLPAMIKPLGIDLSRPAGLALWKFEAGGQTKLVPTVMLSVNPSVLIGSLRLLGFSPRVTKVGGGRMLSLGTGGSGNAVGLLYGNSLYVTARTMTRQLGLASESTIRSFFDLLSKYDGPLASAFTRGKRGKLWAQVQSGKKDVVLYAPGLGQLMGKRSLMIARFVKAIGASLSVQYGLKLQMFMDAAPKLKMAMKPFAPGPHAKDLFPLLPAKLLVYGQAHLHLEQLVKLPRRLAQAGLLNPFFAMMGTSQLGGIRSQMARNGLDFDKLIGMLSGQFAAGVIWDRELRASIARSLRTAFRGHMHGAFMLIGLKAAADGPKILSMFLKAYQQAAKKRPIAAKRLQVTQETSQGATCLKLTPTRQQPMYFCHKGTLLGFAGSASTRDHLLAVWSGAAPSLAQHLKQHPKQAAMFGNTSGNFAGLHPTYFRQIVAETGRLMARTPAAKTFAERLDQLAFSTRFQDASMNAEFAIKLAPKGSRSLPAKYSGPASTLPTSGRNTGIGYAVVLALPVALAGLPIIAPGAVAGFMWRRQRRAMRRYRRRSYRGLRRRRYRRRYRRGRKFRRYGGGSYAQRRKTREVALNIKAIADGAISYFDAEHSNTVGDPLPKAFPNGNYTNKGVGKLTTVTNPPQKPCANGKAQYPKNTKIWQKSPWKELRFSITKPHFFQYTYTASGTGTKASYTITAHADLDCDGTLSTYKQWGRVNKTTGEVERSQLIVIQGLE